MILATALANGVTTTPVFTEGGNFLFSCSAPGGGNSGEADLLWTDEQGTVIQLTSLSPNGSSVAHNSASFPAGFISARYAGTGTVNLTLTRQPPPAEL